MDSIAKRRQIIGSKRKSLAESHESNSKIYSSGAGIDSEKQFPSHVRLILILKYLKSTFVENKLVSYLKYNYYYIHYQQGEQFNLHNLKDYILCRDDCVCQRCGRKATFP
ncbi:MAG: hypothetical protein PHI87_06820 [Candidatus Methanomethylophilus sp.]|nr:hypothetical protein [Methanomethylophilus sp.]MDD4804676.1 hypothetical protein [Candidatus Paceibacterota bacterium]